MKTLCPYIQQFRCNGQILEKHKLFNKMIQEETENMTSYISTKEIRFVIKNFPQRILQAQMIY